MLVIVTGPDKAGKTTLCTHLAKALNMNYIKCVRPKNHEQLVGTVFHLINNPPKESTIIDRWYYPEDLIYEPIMSGNVSELVSYQGVIEHSLKKLGVLYLYVYANEPTLRKRWELVGDEYLTPDRLPYLLKEYHNFYNGTSLSMIPIDTTDMTPEDTFRRAASCISSWTIQRYVEQNPSLRGTD